MQVIRARHPGGPEVLALEEAEPAEPGLGQVRVKVEAAGVNFIDVYMRSGQYPQPMPLVPGLEGAGVVEALGPDVTSLRPGQRVAWAQVAGSYATHVVAPAEQLVLVPDAVDAKTAAAVMLQGMTAHYLSQSTFPLREGATALVHAAAGGVGLLLCQMGKRAGARIIGTVSTRKKAERARAAGADDVILYTETDFEAATRTLTGERGVDVVYDSVGRSTFDKSLACLRPRGTLVLFGQSSGRVPPFDPQVLNQRGSLFLTRPSLGHYIATRAELEARARDLFDWIATGALIVTIDSVHSLSEAASAHRLLESRKTTGKLLLLP